MTTSDESHALALQVSEWARRIRETPPTYRVDGRTVDRETFEEHRAVAVAIFGSAFTSTVRNVDGGIDVTLLRPGELRYHPTESDHG